MRAFEWLYAAVSVLGLAAIIVLACQGSPVPREAEPGGTVALQAAGPGPFAWTASGGTITADGRWTAPTCAAAAFPATYRIEAVSALGTQAFSITVAEAVVGVEVLGAVLSGETTLRPSPVTLQPGQSAQFYARVTYSCHADFHPSRPPGF